jgi:hypothetical protein
MLERFEMSEENEPTPVYEVRQRGGEVLPEGDSEALAQNVDQEPQGIVEGLGRREFIRKGSLGFLALLSLGKESEAVEALAEEMDAGKERNPNEPRLRFEIFHSAHFTEKDAEGLKAKIAKSDVYIPETPGWNREQEKRLRSLVKGDLTLEAYIQEEYNGTVEWLKTHPVAAFRFEELEALAHSDKLLVFVDVPAEHPLVVAGAPEKNFKKDVRFYHDFNETIQSVKVQLKKEADWQAEREGYRMGRLKTSIEFMKKYPHLFPELKGKKDLRILMSLGAYHTPESQEALRSKAYASASRSFTYSPYVYGYRDEAGRRYRFGKEVSNDIAARVLAESFLEEWVITPRLRKSVRDSMKLRHLSRAVAALFSYDEIRQIFENVRPPAGKSSSYIDASVLRGSRELLAIFEQKTAEKASLASVNELPKTEGGVTRLINQLDHARTNPPVRSPAE